MKHRDQKVHFFREFKGSVQDGLRPVSHCGRSRRSNEQFVWNIEVSNLLINCIPCAKAALRYVQGKLSTANKTASVELEGALERQGAALDTYTPLLTRYSWVSEPKPQGASPYDGEF